jgi:hypothetical protein
MDELHALSMATWRQLLGLIAQYDRTGAGGPMTNLILLCRRHHRAVHEAGWAIEGHPASKLRFVRPDGRALPERPPPITEDRRAWLRRHRPGLEAVPRLAFSPG